MQKSHRLIVSALLLGAFLLSACSGAMPSQGGDSPQGSAESSQSTQAVFTGTVEAMGGGQWLISGQQVDVDGSTSVDANIQVGDIVKVEATVSQDGGVLALKIEASLPDDAAANGNDSNANDANTNDDNANANANTNDNGNANSNDDNSNGAPAGPEQEAFGVVEAITTDSITIGGVTYSLATFTEFKSLIAVGDQVKVHVIVNADGTLTIREIEKSTGTGIGDDNGNSNSNFNGSDDNSNGNSNDDNSNDNGDDDNSNGNSNDDDSNSNSNNNG